MQSPFAPACPSTSTVLTLKKTIERLIETLVAYRKS